MARWNDLKLKLYEVCSLGFVDCGTDAVVLSFRGQAGCVPIACTVAPAQGSDKCNLIFSFNNYLCVAYEVRISLCWFCILFLFCFDPLAHSVCPVQCVAGFIYQSVLTCFCISVKKPVRRYMGVCELFAWLP